MNAKLCKRMRREAALASPAGEPARWLVWDGLRKKVINHPRSLRGRYRGVKRLVRSWGGRLHA